MNKVFGLLRLLILTTKSFYFVFPTCQCTEWGKWFKHPVAGTACIDRSVLSKNRFQKLPDEIINEKS